MINNLQEEIGYVWHKFKFRADLITNKKLLNAEEEYIQNNLKFKYSEFVEYFLHIVKMQTKNNKQIAYQIVKLNRAIETLASQGVIVRTFETEYAKRDIFKEFPQFDKKDFYIMPSKKTIDRLKVSVIEKVVVEYNKQAAENGKKEIKDLRSLRLFLINGLKLEEQKASELTQIYNNMNISAIAWNVK